MATPLPFSLWRYLSRCVVQERHINFLRKIEKKEPKNGLSWASCFMLKRKLDAGNPPIGKKQLLSNNRSYHFDIPFTHWIFTFSHNFWSSRDWCKSKLSMFLRWACCSLLNQEAELQITPETDDSNSKMSGTKGNMYYELKSMSVKANKLEIIRNIPGFVNVWMQTTFISLFITAKLALSIA